MTASAASSADKSSGKDEGMSSQSMIHQCLGKVKDMQSQLTKIHLRLFAEKVTDEKVGLESSNMGWGWR